MTKWQQTEVELDENQEKNKDDAYWEIRKRQRVYDDLIEMGTYVVQQYSNADVQPLLDILTKELSRKNARANFKIMKNANQPALQEATSKLAQYLLDQHGNKTITLSKGEEMNITNYLRVINRTNNHSK